jgi:hypothetical protein
MDDMTEQVKKAFDFAADSTKQLITLSTAILTLTITFGKDVLQKVPAGTTQKLTYSWVIYLVSIFFGIATLLALTGTLDPIKKKARGKGTDQEKVGTEEEVKAAGASEQGSQPFTIQGLNVRFFSILQILSFLIATVLVVMTGISGLRTPDVSSESSSSVEQSVRDKQRRLTEAMLRRDGAAIEELVAADGVFMGSLGQVMNKTQLTSALLSADLTIEVIDIDDIGVRIYEKTAIESGHARVKGKYLLQDFSGQFRFSTIFVRRQEAWQLVSIQVARIAQQDDNIKDVSKQPVKTNKHKGKGGRSRHNRSKRHFIK